MMKFAAKFRQMDFFKKLPSDLVEASFTGASLSMIASVGMLLLFFMELSSFLTMKTDTKVIVDQSPMNELLRITFNISFAKMTCEHLTLDVSDSLGSKKINLSKTVRKTPIVESEAKRSSAMRDEVLPMPTYDEHTEDELANTNYVAPLTKEQFEEALAHYPFFVVNFYAPWCPWCQRLAPTWQKVLEQAHEKYPVSDGRLRVASVDCTLQAELCNHNMITGFPSIRVFRKGTDNIVVRGMREHEAYHGDRTATALVAFLDKLVESAGNPRARVPGTKQMTLGEGCQMSGFVLVKKVPGTLHFHMKQQGTSFDSTAIDITHTIHQFSFGNRPSPRRLRTLKKLHPNGMDENFADKLAGQSFLSAQPEFTHEHFMQLIRTTLEPLSGGKFSAYDAYEYTVQSHSYISEMADVPAAKFSFTTSAMQVVVKELPRAWYHFLTTTCAIIGGVYTVFGIVDGVSYGAYHVLKKKVEIGKQG